MQHYNLLDILKQLLNMQSSPDQLQQLSPSIDTISNAKSNNQFENNDSVVSEFVFQTKPGSQQDSSESASKQRDEKLSEREKYRKDKQKDECELCQKKIQGLFTKSKFCVFCNLWVCPEHIIKKREDPVISGEFVEICSRCEDSILQEKLMKKFSEAEKGFEERELRYRSQLYEMEQKLKLNKDRYDSLVHEQECTNKSNKERIETFKTQFSNEQYKLSEMESEAENLHSQYTKLIERNKQIEQERNIQQSEYEKMKSESVQVSNQISAIELDINQTKYEIAEMDQKLARYQVLKEQQDIVKKQKLEKERREQEQKQEQKTKKIQQKVVHEPVDVKEPQKEQQKQTEEKQQSSYAQLDAILNSLSEQQKSQVSQRKSFRKDKKDQSQFYCL